MSKNISIKERNQNLKYKTTFLKTALQGGGYCEWVPESEVETEVLRAYSNGYYVPDKYAYSQAVVNVPAIFVQGMEGLEQMIYSLDIDGIIISEIVPIDFPDISTNPFIMEDLRIITIDPTTGEKFDITFPEEFELMSSLLSPFSSDWLIADFDDFTQIISHPDGIDTTPFVDPVDTSGAQIPVVDVNIDNDYIIGVDDLGNFHVASISTEGFVSTTMLGFTPTTFAFDANGMMTGLDTDGNEMVAILNDGVVTQEHLPSSIDIIVEPTKLTYVEGETIDITGMVVVAKNADGTTWTNAEYPNGHIPLQELSIEPTTASLNEQGEEWSDDDGINAIALSIVKTEQDAWHRFVYYFYKDEHTTFAGLGPKDSSISSYPSKILATRYISEYGEAIYCAKGNSEPNPPNVYSLRSSLASTSFHPNVIVDSFSKFTDMLYYYPDFVSIIPESTKNPLGISISTLHPSTQIITVKWYRTGDGEELDTEFGISVSRGPNGIGGDF